MIMKYDIEAADLFDNCPKKFRLIVFILDDLYTGRFRGIYNRFLKFEYYLSENSLRRKMNKLYIKGILNDHE